jgi:putative membrane protein
MARRGPLDEESAPVGDAVAAPTPQRVAFSSRNPVADWIIRVVKGVAISLGFILPGVSGGVLAAILGIYERLLRFLAHITRGFVANLLYFLPVAVGGVIGLVLLSSPLEYLLEHWQVVVLWGFAGAILGTIPALARTSLARGARDGTDWTWLVGTFVVGAAVLYLLPVVAGRVPANFLGFVLAGALTALGVLVPGLSPSNLLLILGLFQPMLDGFASRDIVGVFLPFIIGAVVIIVAFSKLMEKVLDRFHSRVYHFIIGLVLASTVLIVTPTQSAEAIDYTGAGAGTIIGAVIAFVAGGALGLWMAKLESKYK